MTINSKRADLQDQLRLLQSALDPNKIDARLPYMMQIAEQLREAIMTLQLMPGTPISESAIAQVLGLSRTPVREALKVLEDEEFVDIFPQAGTVVSRIRISLIEHGSFVRRALECANVLELAAKLNAAGKDEINAIMAAQASALQAQDVARFIVHDDALHHVFFVLNQRLDAWQIVQRFRQHIYRARRLLAHEDQSRCAAAYEEHITIVQALFEKDLTTLQNHITSHVSHLPQVLQSHLNALHPSWVQE